MHLTKDILEKLNLDKLILPPYSPDLAHSDYHLFIMGLQTNSHDLSLTSKEKVEHELVGLTSKRRILQARHL